MGGGGPQEAYTLQHDSMYSQMAWSSSSMKEYAVSFGREQSLVGILSENGGADANAQDDPTGVLLLNAGLIHRIGPNLRNR